ncbi:YlzJ-like protein [Natranaerovirga hydrolytica]|uniref:YlzJ-like protein n=1 Tax=Natranaerovirga hydrolytica TaxID=680378 RepID=A0A4V2Q1K3_9FIRM|nr:YlzJ-like family protein [Natranaerovirga hydrolytica]TCK97951.1 YlzJ-like protein [Natranaerovirga hydrolytica]
MLYSIIPEEIVMKEEPEETYDYEEVSLKNCTLQVCKNGDAFKINRVISTDPSVYLDQELQPGMTLSALRLNALIHQD